MATLGFVLAISGCAMTAGDTGASPGVNSVATATAAVTAAPSPRPIAAFTCADGSLPVQPAMAPTSCLVSAQSGAPVLHATYSSAANGETPKVDEYALTSSGWKLATVAHADGAVTSRGYGVYFFHRAWFAFQWIAHSDGSGSLTVQTSVPATNAPLICGQIPAADSAQLNGAALPSGSFPILDGSMALAPACVADTQRFYESVLPSAGWHEDQPFMSIPDAPDMTQVQNAIFSRGGTQEYIATAGYTGTLTLITVQTRP